MLFFCINCALCKFAGERYAEGSRIIGCPQPGDYLAHRNTRLWTIQFRGAAVTLKIHCRNRAERFVIGRQEHAVDSEYPTCLPSDCGVNGTPRTFPRFEMPKSTMHLRCSTARVRLHIAPHTQYTQWPISNRRLLTLSGNKSNHGSYNPIRNWAS